MPFDPEDLPELATPADVAQALTEAKTYTDEAVTNHVHDVPVAEPAPVPDDDEDEEARASVAALTDRVTALEQKPVAADDDEDEEARASLLDLQARVAYLENRPVGGGGGNSLTLRLQSDFGGNLPAAVAEAEKSGGRSPVIESETRYQSFSATATVSRRIFFNGNGTLFHHADGFNGPMIRMNQGKRNGQLEGSNGSQPITTYDPDTDDGGAVFCNFTIADRNRHTPGRQGIYLMGADDIRMFNVGFRMLTGTALKLGADEADKGATSPASGRVRECNFDGIDIYRCGSGSPTGSPDVPAFILQSADGAGDGSNQNYFRNFRFVYNEGRMLISGRNAANSLRRTSFETVQLHALADNPNWSPSKWFPFNMVTLEGNVRETLFRTVFINGTKAGTAGWHLRGNAAGTPKRLTLRDVNVVNMDGDVVAVNGGDSVVIDGTSMGAVGGKIIAADTGSGLARWHVHEYGINSPAGKSTGLTGTGSFQHSGLPVNP